MTCRRRHLVGTAARKNEPRVEYYARVKNNAIANAVKHYDIEDNLDEDRLFELELEQAARLRAKYEKALEALGPLPAIADML